jgi:hypothetical protein
MIACYKIIVFATFACSLGAIAMPLAAGGEESAVEGSEVDLVGRLPVAASKPCPIEKMRYFTTTKDIIAREATEKYYLVDIKDGHATKLKVYLLDDGEAMDRVHRWLTANGKRLEERSNIAMLPQILPWHNELLQCDRNGNVVSCMADYCEAEEYERLVALFRDSGRQVNTVPGRKPPVVKDSGKQISIEWENGE